MKNPFGKKIKKDKKLKVSEEERAEQVRKSTQQIEDEKNEKKFKREERKFIKEQEAKRKRLERFIAPILLTLTILVSYLIYLMR